MNRLFRSSPPPAENLSLSPISLLTPDPDAASMPPKSPDWEGDLGLSDLLNALSMDRRYQRFMRGVLIGLPTDPEIIHWRQGVLADFVANPQMVADLAELLPHLAGLSEDNVMLGRKTRSALMQTSDRLSELDMYTELLATLHNVLNLATLQSPTMIALRDDIGRVVALPDYQRLREELPALREPLRNIGSLTIGINLDDNLRPTSAVLMAINARELGHPPSLLDRMLGTADEDESPFGGAQGVAAAHKFSPDPKMRRYDELFQDMDKLMQKTAKPIAERLRHYVRTHSRALVQLEPEIAFFVAAVQLIKRAEAKGVPFCQPEIAPLDERITQAEGLHNIALLLRNDARPVPSEARFDGEGRIAVLTGPNSGGKTTYLRNIGLAQVMFQAGLFVPATAARMSPVDHLLTHFPRLETRDQGRLAEEAARLRTLFAQATKHSLVLLNETFSSTALGEALYLAQDVLSALCVIGVRAVFATHIVELVDNFEQIEDGVQVSSNLFSLVAGIELDANGNATPTYQITRRLPLGRSYAEEIARHHGISLDQILAGRNGAGSDASA
jgi:DNA mismatch repair protein MutS